MATAQSLSHVWPLGTTINAAGHIEVGGCDLVELAREVGTPAYVVAEDDLRARARAFREAFAAQAPGVHLSFATKAFPCTAVLRTLAEEGIGADVASGGELHLALRAGVAPEQIILHGNAKSERELVEALDAGVGTIVLDNADELTRLERLADRPQSVMLRINPDVRGDTHDHISTGQADAKFGFSLADAPGIMKRVRGSGLLTLRGVHMHIGSQLLELEPFRRAVASARTLGPVDAVNVGGGLGVAYTAADHPPSVEDYAAAKVGAIRGRRGGPRASAGSTAPSSGGRITCACAWSSATAASGRIRCRAARRRCRTSCSPTGWSAWTPRRRPSPPAIRSTCSSTDGPAQQVVAAGGQLPACKIGELLLSGESRFPVR